MCLCCFLLFCDSSQISDIKSLIVGLQSNEEVRLRATRFTVPTTSLCFINLKLMECNLITSNRNHIINATLHRSKSNPPALFYSKASHKLFSCIYRALDSHFSHFSAFPSLVGSQPPFGQLITRAIKGCGQGGWQTNHPCPHPHNGRACGLLHVLNAI